MNIFGSSGKKYKRLAEKYINMANDVQDVQSAEDFKRGLLANIRENRMANAMVSVGNYSDDYTSSSVAGAKANINSAFVGDTAYSYESSDRAQLIQDYTETAQKYYQKYQKKQNKRSMLGSIGGLIVGGVAGAMTGGFGLGLTSLAGGLLGAQAGQGVGQILSGTGQEMQGVSNLIGAGATAYRFDTANRVNEGYRNINNVYQSYLNSRGWKRYEVASLINNMDERDVEIVTLFGGY